MKTPACIIHFHITPILIPNEVAMMDVIAMNSKGINNDELFLGRSPAQHSGARVPRRKDRNRHRRAHDIVSAPSTDPQLPKMSAGPWVWGSTSCPLPAPLLLCRHWSSFKRMWGEARVCRSPYLNGSHTPFPEAALLWENTLFHISC